MDQIPKLYDDTGYHQAQRSKQDGGPFSIPLTEYIGHISLFWTHSVKDMPKQTRQLITPKEQAHRLSCSLRHLQNMKNSRIVPHLKLGRLVRYDPEAVDRALERLTVKAIE